MNSSEDIIWIYKPSDVDIVWIQYGNNMKGEYTGTMDITGTSWGYQKWQLEYYWNIKKDQWGNILQGGAP